MHVPTCLEARVHTHKADCTHSCVRMYHRQQAFFFPRTLGSYSGYANTCMYSCRSAVHIVLRQHIFNRRTHVPHMLEHACAPNRHACTLTLVCLLMGVTFYPSMDSCVVASMNKDQRNARAWGLFVDHPGYCCATRLRILHCAMCAARRAQLLHACCSSPAGSGNLWSGPACNSSSGWGRLQGPYVVKVCYSVSVF